MAAKRLYYGQGSLYRKRKKNARGKSEEYGNFRIKYTDAQGNEQIVKLNTPDRAVAEELYTEWVNRRKRGDDPQQEAAQTVVDFLLGWIARREEEARTRGSIRLKTAGRYRNILMPLVKYLEDHNLQYLTLQELTTKHLNDYLTCRAGQTRFNNESDVPLTKSGLHREWKIIRSIFRKCFQRRVLAKDVTEGVVPFKVENKVKYLPKISEVLEVARRVAEEPVRDFIRIGLLTGARSAEITHLKWLNVDFERGLLHIVEEDALTAKTDSPRQSQPKNANPPAGENHGGLKTDNARRTIPMPDELMTLLKSRRQARQHEPADAYILVMADGRPFNAYPNYVYRRTGKALRHANKDRAARGEDAIPTFTPHTLRHIFITEALTRPDHPLTEAELVKIVGHADFAMIRRTYLHVDPQGHTADKMRRFRLSDESAEARS